MSHATMRRVAGTVACLVICAALFASLTGCGFAAKEALFKNPRVQSILDKLNT